MTAYDAKRKFRLVRFGMRSLLLIIKLPDHEHQGQRVELSRAEITSANVDFSLKPHL
jgi:hypothetical protein